MFPADYDLYTEQTTIKSNISTAAKTQSQPNSSGNEWKDRSVSSQGQKTLQSICVTHTHTVPGDFAN